MNQEKGKSTEETRHNPWMWIIVAIAAPLLMLMMAFAPSVLWVLWLYILMMLPEGSDPVYDGMKLKVSDKEVYRISMGYEINAQRGSQPERTPLPRNFFVLINGEAKALADVRPADLLAEGFEDPGGGLWYESSMGPHFSLAIFNTKKELEYLGLRSAEYGTLAFSSSPSGPFLSLPVSFSEFQKQFGRPVRWEKQYRSRQFAP